MILSCFEDFELKFDYRLMHIVDVIAENKYIYSEFAEKIEINEMRDEVFKSVSQILKVLSKYVSSYSIFLTINSIRMTFDEYIIQFLTKLRDQESTIVVNPTMIELYCYLIIYSVDKLLEDEEAFFIPKREKIVRRTIDKISNFVSYPGSTGLMTEKAIESLEKILKKKFKSPEMISSQKSTCKAG